MGLTRQTREMLKKSSWYPKIFQWQAVNSNGERIFFLRAQYKMLYLMQLRLIEGDND